jgi:TonB family protein
MEAEGREAVSTEIEVKRERPLKAVTCTLPAAGGGQAMVQPGQFVAFGPEVTPPRRISGAVPAYPEAARDRRLEGAPVVEVWVSETGDVIDVAILESAGAVLDEALLEAVATWRFSPASLRGVPVSLRLTVQHLFRC